MIVKFLSEVLPIPSTKHYIHLINNLRLRDSGLHCQIMGVFGQILSALNFQTMYKKLVIDYPDMEIKNYVQKEFDQLFKPDSDLIEDHRIS